MASKRALAEVKTTDINHGKLLLALSATVSVSFKIASGRIDLVNQKLSIITCGMIEYNGNFQARLEHV